MKWSIYNFCRFCTIFLSSYFEIDKEGFASKNSQKSNVEREEMENGHLWSLECCLKVIQVC